MEDSDRPHEGIDLEELREWIPRRKVLGGVTALVVGWRLYSQSSAEESNSETTLSEAEIRFVELAGTINDADLVNPRRSRGLHYQVTKAIDSVNAVLNRNLPDEPQAERRVAALRAATEYYSTLAKALDTATALLARTEDPEHTILNHEPSLEYNSVDDLDTAAFKRSITRISEAEKDSDTVTTQAGKLVPDQQQVVDSLRTRRDVLDQFRTGQQTYLETAITIEDSIRALEKSQFDTARSTLTEARKSLTTGIPGMKNQYSLSNSGPSLNQYATLLTLRRKGVSKLLGVCDESVSQEQRQSVSNEALNLFFEARHIVIK